jgi:hypothetical protein
VKHRAFVYSIVRCSGGRYCYPTSPFSENLNMLPRLESFQGAIIEYLSKQLGEGSEVMLRTISARLSRVLNQVYEGILISSSSLRRQSEPISETVKSILGGLVEKKIFLIVLSDDDSATEQLREAIGHFEVVRPMDYEASTDCSRHIRELVAEKGYYDGRIAIVSALNQQLLPVLMTLSVEGTNTVFSTDFDTNSAWDPPTALSLPVISPPASTPCHGPEAVAILLDTLVFARRINVRETAWLVTQGDREGGILDRLDEVSEWAESNRASGLVQLQEAYPRPDINEIFDHRSGGVFFQPSEWRRLTRELGGDQAIFSYFQERFSGYWQPGRPCYRRILYTPTKVLLRGEHYYAHMKNMPPVDRIRAMLVELGQIQRLAGDAVALMKSSSDSGDLRRWKLCLAFIDQLRNIVLQLFSFVHATSGIFQSLATQPGVDSGEAAGVAESARELFSGDALKLHGLVGKSVRAFYSWLINGQYSGRALTNAMEVAPSVAPPLMQLCKRLDDFFSHTNLDPGQLKAGELVRRWREADHPGENLLIAFLAVEEMKKCDSINAVGIGWGGIELPLVFDYIARIRGIPAAQNSRLNVHIANWSHYRAEEQPISWVPFPRHTDLVPNFSPGGNVVFDDNVLSGITLDKVRNEMLLRGAKDIEIFVTRFSGERRWAHMKMKQHGVVDPDFMIECVKGYLGETPFARSWSTKKGEYTSQIGVFSLARRRILECIHNNSTVEAWDREGF